MRIAHRVDERTQRATAALARGDTVVSRQLGDPARAAQAVLAAVDAEHPPLHRLLGSDALRRARAKLDAVIEQIDQWEAVTRSTDFPD